MKLIVIDYGAGNVQSVINAINQIDNSLQIIVSKEISDLKSANYLFCRVLVLLVIVWRH